MSRTARRKPKLPRVPLPLTPTRPHVVKTKVKPRKAKHRLRPVDEPDDYAVDPDYSDDPWGDCRIG